MYLGTPAFPRQGSHPRQMSGTALTQPWPRPASRPLETAAVQAGALHSHQPQEMRSWVQRGKQTNLLVTYI